MMEIAIPVTFLRLNVKGGGAGGGSTQCILKCYVERDT